MIPLVTWIAVLWHNVFNRIILNNDWSFVPEVFKVAENEVSGTHIFSSYYIGVPTSIKLPSGS